MAGSLLRRPSSRLMQRRTGRIDGYGNKTRCKSHGIEIRLNLLLVNGVHDDDELWWPITHEPWRNDAVAGSSNVSAMLVRIDVDHVVDLVANPEGCEKRHGLRAAA